MRYSIDTDRISLADLRKRIEETDLVPSRNSLLDGIEEKFQKFERQDVSTFRHLRDELKNSKRMEALSIATEISIEYLVLLQREIESYLPKPFNLKEFGWLPQDEITKLESAGIRTSADLYEALDGFEQKSYLDKSSGIDPIVLESLAHLVDLTRVQWVSPITARMLMEASCDSVGKLAAAQAEELDAAVQRVNEGGHFFKGKIGLRDIKRLIQAASYVVG